MSITSEVLICFWNCLAEDNKFQEQIGNDLEKVNKLEKHVNLVNYYFVDYFANNFICF